ncbi:hypothetical protein GDO81_014602 [Engystomops pustulosus]|uniref:Uncharacterized protein n=1 Tax=Engystomops pustulosus TaxID=76066 RepID=A0AAV7BBK9_ENGPU|nr:hypothetical protein GDO81_014602 [Engystomops pustulosus]
MEISKDPPPYPPPVTTHTQYGQPSPHVVVTTQPTSVVVPQPLYKDHLSWSIVNMICCCLPLGIAALVFSIQTKDAIHRQDYPAAAQRSRSAYIINIVALVLGLCIHIAWIVYTLLAIFTIRQSYQHYYYNG